VATIRKRGKSWQVIIKRGRDGRLGVRRKNFPTRREALIWAEETSTAMRVQPGRVIADAGRQTLADYLWEALRAKAETLHCGTDVDAWFSPDVPYELRQWALCIRRMTTQDFIFFATPIEQISGENLAHYFSARLQKCKINTLKRHDINLIRSAYRIAGQQHALAPGWADFQNFFSRSILRDSAGHAGSKQSRRVSRDAEKVLIETTLMPQLSLAIILSIETALRQSELCRAEWQQIEWENKELWLPGEQTKNRRARTIQLTDRAISALGKLRKIYPNSERLFGGWTQTALRMAWRREKKRLSAIAEGARATLRLTDDFGVSQDVEEARAVLAIAPIIERVRWHDFRHEGISRWLDSGMPAHVVSDMSGHITATVLSNYSHARSRAARAFLHILNDQNCEKDDKIKVPRETLLVKK